MFSIFGKVVLHKEKDKTKFGKKVLFPNRDILWKPNENHKKPHEFYVENLKFFSSEKG